MRRFFLASAVLVLNLAGCVGGRQPEPLWVGHVTPGKGRNKDNGEAAIQGMEATLRLTRQAGWPGDRPLAIRHADSSAGQPGDNAIRLLAVNRVSALILGPGVPGMAGRTPAGVTGVPLVLLDEQAAVPVEPAVVLLGPDPVQRGEALAQVARTRLKATRILLITDPDDPVCATLAGAFTRVWGKGNSLIELRYDAADIQPFLPRVVVAAVPLARLRQVADRFARNKDRGVSVLYGGPDVEEEALLGAAGGHTVYHATVFTASAPLPESAQVWRREFARLSPLPPGRAAILGADAVRLLLHAMESGATSARGVLQETLDEITEMEGITGKITWAEYRPRRPLFLLECAGGKRRQVDRLAMEGS